MSERQHRRFLANQEFDSVMCTTLASAIVDRAAELEQQKQAEWKRKAEHMRKCEIARAVRVRNPKEQTTPRSYFKLYIVETVKLSCRMENWWMTDSWHRPGNNRCCLSLTYPTVTVVAYRQG